MVQEIENMPPPPIRNMRQVNPVRESGPLPVYDGPHTMEDIRRIYQNTMVGLDKHHVSTDVDEIMRRVPGISRKEAEHITTYLYSNPDSDSPLTRKSTLPTLLTISGSTFSTLQTRCTSPDRS